MNNEIKFPVGSQVRIIKLGVKGEVIAVTMWNVKPPEYLVEYVNVYREIVLEWLTYNQMVMATTTKEDQSAVLPMRRK